MKQNVLINIFITFKMFILIWKEFTYFTYNVKSFKKKTCVNKI